MIPNDIDKLINQRQTKTKKDKNQSFYAVSLIVIIFILCAILYKKYYTYAVCLGVGTIIGMILRYSRFCFAAAFRDPFITGSTKILRGIILALIISTIGFAVIQSQYIHDKGTNYHLIPGEVSSVGIHVVVGAFIFGIGMVLASGCSSGVLMRLGEGYTVYLVVLLGFIIGTLLGAKSYPFWYDNFIKDAKTIYFSEYLDIKIVAVLQIIVLMILYWIALRYENKHNIK